MTTNFPVSWPQSAESTPFWARLRAARRSILMLDYDGTLAPFKNNPIEAYPYPGIEDRLIALSTSPRVRLALVSGRPAHQLAELLSSLGLTTGLDIWGNHGREHLRADGSYELQPLPAAERETLERVKREIERLGFSRAIEAKPASLAFHWRGFEPTLQQQIRSAVESLYAQQAAESGLDLLPFDGGLELRSGGHTKGTAVKRILAEEEPGLPAAYMGDDLTDEDAFRAMGNRGLSLLVRGEPRESSARFWIKPPAELFEFLDRWAGDPSAENLL